MLNWILKFFFPQSLNLLSLLIRSSLSIYSKWLTRLNTVSILHSPMGLAQANAWDVWQNVYKWIKFRNVLQTLSTWFSFIWQQSKFLEMLSHFYLEKIIKGTPYTFRTIWTIKLIFIFLNIVDIFKYSYFQRLSRSWNFYTFKDFVINVLCCIIYI